jgi:kynurenine formamidase
MSTSRYGPGDQVGGGNEITPERVLAALRLPTSGRVIELGRVLDAASPPTSAHRIWHQVVLAHGALLHAERFDPLVGMTASAPEGTPRPTYFEEQVTQTYHIGTHLDALGHVGIDDRFYNGVHYADMYGIGGFRRLGIENVRPWLVRGVCLDVAAVEGADMLPEGFVVTPAHLEAACRRAGIEVRGGDAVVLHTGWGSLWDDDPERYTRGEPGPALAAARWLSERRVSLVGADNFAVEALPGEDTWAPAPVHQHLLAEAGINILENVATAELAGERIAEFLFVLSPPKTRGSTGAMAAPLAVV